MFCDRTEECQMCNCTTSSKSSPRKKVYYDSLVIYSFHLEKKSSDFMVLFNNLNM